MTDLSDKLSAYLDGALPAPEAAEIEAWLEADPDAQVQLEALMHVDALARDAFDAQLTEPVPFAIAQSIKSAAMPPAAMPRRPVWGSVAAALAMLMIGGAGGYMAKGASTPVQTAGWLQDIADYHAVYAAQGRHLVEVSANDADHIETWLGNTIGARFTIPDLSAHGLSFEGGRLLVANGAPVAQLMYRNDKGEVIALCLQNNQGSSAGTGFKRQNIQEFTFVSWRSPELKSVVIGPEGTAGLDQIAQSAAVSL